MTRVFRLVLLGLWIVPAWPASGQDAALNDRVASLVEKLGSEKADDREAAEKALIGLGPRALSLLPEESKVQGELRKQRLAKVREELEAALESASLDASRVTIQAKGIRLTEALKALQVQSNNRLTDLREALGADATNPSLDLDIQDRPFFEALDILCKKAELAPEFYTGDGSIGLKPGEPDLPDMIGVEPKRNAALIQYPGPFRVVLKRISSTLDLETNQGRANAQIEFAWEPRLRPMLLALKANQLEIVDNEGNTVLPDVMDESSSVVLRPENPVAELNLNMEAPLRSARSLQRLKIKADVTIPAGLKRFQFPKLDAKNVTIQQGDIKVTLESAQAEEQVWRIRVRLEMPGEGPAFESYQQGLFNNRLWLQRADGSRFEHNGGFSNTEVRPGRLGFEYIFVDAPGTLSDYQFVYETPSRVLTIPVAFEFHDVPLP